MTPPAPRSGAGAQPGAGTDEPRPYGRQDFEFRERVAIEALRMLQHLRPNPSNSTPPRTLAALNERVIAAYVLAATAQFDAGCQYMTEASTEQRLATVKTYLAHALEDGVSPVVALDDHQHKWFVNIRGYVNRWLVAGYSSDMYT